VATTATEGLKDLGSLLLDSLHSKGLNDLKVSVCPRIELMRCGINQ